MELQRSQQYSYRVILGSCFIKKTSSFQGFHSASLFCSNRCERRDMVTNTDTETKADSTRISPSCVNMGLARNNLCEFYWTNIRMIFFFKYHFEEVVCFFFKTRLSAFIIFLRKCPQKADIFIFLTVKSTSKSHLLSV